MMATYKKLGDYAEATTIAAADILLGIQGGANVKVPGSVLLDLIYPVGYQYEMYAVAASNDAAVAFPEAERPAALFGGTWALLWDSDGVFFRTEGDGGYADVTTGRTDGQQRDQMQRITGSFNLSRRGTGGGARLATPNTGALGQTQNGGEGFSGAAETLSATYNSDLMTLNSANSPDARASASTAGETRPTNRLMRIYRRTA
jgi:hypothetical protein